MTCFARFVKCDVSQDLFGTEDLVKVTRQFKLFNSQSWCGITRKFHRTKEGSHYLRPLMCARLICKLDFLLMSFCRSPDVKIVLTPSRCLSARNALNFRPGDLFTSRQLPLSR